ncbi:hypothetical protein [Chitinophaga caseinilytica]|uniref:hypothetical protein n=1 Tax=Chitinophaga caseinilytica TaxID=2267521 RepID=UPI003C2EB8F7
MNPEDLLLVRIESSSEATYFRDTIEFIYNTDFTVKEIRQISPRFAGGYRTVATTTYENGRLMVIETDQFPTKRGMYKRTEMEWKDGKIACIRYFDERLVNTRLDSLFYDGGDHLIDHKEFTVLNSIPLIKLKPRHRTLLTWQGENVAEETFFTNVENPEIKGNTLHLNYTNRPNIMYQCVKDNLMWHLLHTVVSEFLSKNAPDKFRFPNPDGTLKTLNLHRYGFDAAKMVLGYGLYSDSTLSYYSTYYFRRK